ncbi:Hypothetical protein CINCED_3A014541 [Cinara cedri]|nr:Hypothetical protein CINCED_3A014541 [Cinara cedri]
MDLLFWSIIFSYLNFLSIKFTPKLISLFLYYYNGEQKIKSEILLLEKEQSKISIVKEFAKHAKLQRKINMLIKQMEYNFQKNVSRNMKIKMTCTLILYFFSVVSNYIFISKYRYEIVLDQLPSEWFSPFSWLISWPLSKVGTMSFFFWFCCTNYVAQATVNGSLVLRKLKSILLCSTKMDFLNDVVQVNGRQPKQLTWVKDTHMNEQ